MNSQSPVALAAFQRMFYRSGHRASSVGVPGRPVVLLGPAALSGRAPQNNAASVGLLGGRGDSEVEFNRPGEMFQFLVLDF